MRARPHPSPWPVLLLFAVAMACAPAPAPETPWGPEVPLVWSGPPIWVESPMVKIGPRTAPGSLRELNLYAARNEFVSFQVAIHGGETGVTIDSVSLSALRGPGVISIGNVTLYRQTFLEITRPSTQSSHAGSWPDGLIPDFDELTGEKRRAFPFTVPAGEVRALWVDVHVPEGARPGAYRGSAWVTTSDGARLELRIGLTVVDMLMESTPSLKSAFFLRTPYVCQAFAGKQECEDEELLRLLPLFYRLGLEHRITLAGSFPHLRGRAAWREEDWNTLELLWGPFLDGTSSARLLGARMTSWQYLGPSNAEGLAEFSRESSTRGWLPRAFHYVGDEPPLYSTFDEVRRRASLTRQSAPALQTLLTSDIDGLENAGLEEVVDILAVVINSLTPAPPRQGDQRERYKDFLSRPARELWLYQSCVSHGCGTFLPENEPGQGWPSYMIDRPAAKARAMEWVSFLEGATGELYYHTAEALDSAWTDQFRFNGNGDGTLFYPGTPALIGGSTAVPVPSLRLKLIRLGFQDYEWLKAVSDAGDPEYARKVARQVIPATWRVPDDGTLFEVARLCLMRRYLELTVARTPGTDRPIDVPCPESLGGPPP
ncbi:DUF4091 domain-containing protein [Hyalangium rubrum]|uniref:DUF6067 family protein n=1 Tax=Hyalangium rubrum TaxID=3103134 RepID=A0ABU5HBU6_9BACT|nr:glycoside hydrolase domain-containing protein [Hyalangium sp. s54d21]MDY7230602.1 DUF6067 family protein [Hyalangium sp. s54d21]